MEKSASKRPLSRPASDPPESEKPSNESKSDSDPPVKKQALSSSTEESPVSPNHGSNGAQASDKKVTNNPSGKAKAISLKLSSFKATVQNPVASEKPVKKCVAAAFSQDDSDSEEEEIPLEAKMRMRNLGKDTPTACGPNSFNKGKTGFSDKRKIQERKIKELLGTRD